MCSEIENGYESRKNDNSYISSIYYAIYVVNLGMQNNYTTTIKPIMYSISYALFAFFAGSILMLIVLGFIDRESLKVIRGLSQ